MDRLRFSSTFGVAQSLFTRGLALVYLLAFLSWWVQVDGLVGSRGLAPMEPWLAEVKRQLGPWSWLQVPTVFLLSGSDAMLHAVCALGCVTALLVMAGGIQGPGLVLLWLLYLSLVATGNVFMNFQWDALLLEAGLIAPFLAPWRWWTGPRRIDTGAPRVPILLLWLLLGKLMFLSGLVKLTSGDPAWRDGSALAYHFETQPIPHAVAWYAHQLPAGVLTASVWAMFAIELVLPWCILLGRWGRMAAFAGFVGLMGLIAATGNFTFFNLLTVILCLALLDDDVVPRRWFTTGVSSGSPRGVGAVLRPAALTCLAGLSLAACFPAGMTGFLRPVQSAMAPFRSVNSYGLFRVMTKERPEIIFEGSDDGITWQAYHHRWKPDRLEEMPRLVAPHQPRLDWQMWFAALGGPYQRSSHTVWMEGLVVRLLEGEPAVLRLFVENPFPDAPPRYLRARLFRYEFTTFAERNASGDWWKRVELGLYFPVVERRSP